MVEQTRFSAINRKSRTHLKKNFEILIIEDNPGDVRLLEEVFTELCPNVTMRVAKDGAEGLEMLSAEAASGKPGWRPDLVLLDLNLPKVSGHEVLEKVKNDRRTSRIPIIVLTSSRADSDIRRAYDCHANAYLKKPSTLDGLFAAANHIKSFWLDTATLPR